MSSVKNLIIVPDDHYHKTENFTFLVYDADSGELKHKIPKNNDLNCEELEGQGRPTFRPFGITTDDDYLYVASNKKLGKYDKNSFEYIGLVDIPMYINTHQILKDNDIFYVTHTAVNLIGIHNTENKYFDVASLQFVERPVDPLRVNEYDINHVNSLVEYDNKIYFCLHNLNTKPSEFGYFEKHTYESKIIASAGSCCHDIQILNGKLYSLSSHTGDIIEIDLSDNKTKIYKVVDGNKTFLRGMDILDNKIVFVASNLYSDGEMFMGNCFVGEFDTVTKKSNRKFNIPESDIVVCMKVI